MFRSRLFSQVLVAGLVTGLSVVAVQVEAGHRKRSRCCQPVPNCCKPVCCVVPAPVCCPPVCAPSVAPVVYESVGQPPMQSLPHYEELPPVDADQGSSAAGEGGDGGAVDGAGQTPPPPSVLDPIPGEARRQRPQHDSEQLVTSASPTPGDVPSAAVRIWQDITGQHETTGHLLWVRDDIARIAKTSGTTTTVSLKNLSERDRQYIDQFLASNH